MKSVFEQLETLSKDFKHSTFKVISAKMIELFHKGKFLKQEEIAKICFVSISTITKYSKFLGYSGYRELIFALKNEYNNFEFKSKLNLSNKNSNTKEVFENISNWIDSSYEFVDLFISRIANKQKLVIWSSYQTKTSADYLSNLLNSMSIETVVLDNQFVNINFNEKNNVVNLLLLSGRDNDTLIRNFLNYYDKSEDNFLIASPKQYGKIGLEMNNKIYFNFEGDNSSVAIRVTALHMLFFNIYNKL